MKKVILAAVLIAVLLFVFSGCSGGGSVASASPSASENASEEASADASAQSGTVISASGSDYVEALVNELALNYMGSHTDVTINPEVTNSNLGMAYCAEGTADIGLSSRELKDAEKAVFIDMESTEICLDGIAVVVSADSPVNGLSAEEVKNIFLRETTNWDELGKDSAEINVYTMSSSMELRKVFNEQFLGKDDEGGQLDTEDSTSSIVSSSEELIEALNNDSNAIGYMQLSDLPSDGTVKAIKIDSVTANADNIKSGRYSYVLKFILLTRGSADAEAFVGYCAGSEAAEYLESEGYILP